MSYEAAGVTEYEYMATMDARTCEVCGALDGKHFPTKDATPGVNFPPMHPNDRCTTVEYDPEDAADWAASGEKMPESMTYEEWKDKQGIEEESDVSDAARRAAKSLVTGKKVVSFSGLPQEVRKDFRAGLNNANPEVAKALRKVYRDVDYANVNDFNANMDILEAEAAKAKARQATLLVHAPAGYSIEVVHQSCAYTAVSTAVGNDAYATIVLPFGGCATINFRQNTQTEDVKCTLVEDLIVDGRTTHIILSDDLIAYQSPLSAIPAGTYAAGGPCAPGGASGYVVTFCGKSHTIERKSFDEFKTGYSTISDANKKLDAKNELWHAARIGMITAVDYKTITGEDYPNIPPTRVETKAAL